MISGSALSPWINGIKGSGKLVAKALDFYDQDEAQMLKYLRQVRVEELLEAQEELFPVSTPSNQST